MKLLFALAWRNLWRNRKRSLISMASVVFALVIALFMRSMQLGFYQRSIENVVSVYTGYLQIQAPGWKDRPDLDHSLADPDALVKRIQRVAPQVSTTAVRLECFALLSTGELTDGVQLIGIDPAAELTFSKLQDRVSQGRPFSGPEDSGILLGEELAAHLGVAPGDTIVALGAGYHGQSAAGRFVIAGLLNFPTPEMSAGLAWLTLREAQRFAGMENRATSIAMMLPSQRDQAAVEAALRKEFAGDTAVYSWQELLPEMVQYIQVDNAGGIMMLVLLYCVVGFGILGTVLMMTLERGREFGVLVALGLGKRKLAAMVTLESLLLTVCAALIGLAIALPLLLWMHSHPLTLEGAYADAMLLYGFEPLMPFSLSPSIFIWQTVTVLLIAFTALLWPLLRITGLEIVPAMRAGR